MSHRERLPWVVTLLINAAVPAEDREVVIGDMLEAARCVEQDARRRRAWLRREALRTAVAFLVDRSNRGRETTGQLSSNDRSPNQRDSRRGAAISQGLADLRLAFRRLQRRPGESSLAMLILAIGLGVTTAIFAVVRGVLLEPLDLPNPDALVVLWTTDEASGVSFNNSGPNVLDWGRRDDLFAGLFAYLRETTIIESRDGGRARVEVARVGADVFDVIGMPMAVGRGFSPNEEGANRARVVVLDYDYWQRNYGGRSDAVGSLVSIDGRNHEIVGVTAPGFGLPQLPERGLYLPFDRPLDGPGRDQVWLGAAARLRPGVSPAEAQTVLDVMHQGLIEAHPEIAGTRVTLRTVRADLVAPVRVPLEMLLTGAVFVLLLAVANVANMLLARLLRRRGEFGVRRALGASGGRLLRQLATENAVLVGAAASVGLSIVALSRLALKSASALGLPRAEAVRFDLPILLFAFVAAAAVVVFATVPLSALGVGNLRGSALGGAARLGRGPFRQSLVVVQVALAAILLVGSGLLGHSLIKLLRSDPGFHPEGVLVADLQLPGDVFAGRQEQSAFLARLERAALELPGVESAGLTLFPPLREPRVNYGVVIRGREAEAAGHEPAVDLNVATMGYFETLGIPLLAGQGFGDGDANRPAEIIVSQATATVLWGDASPLGESLGIRFASDAEPRWHRVVGVVGDVKQTGLDVPDPDLVYLDMMQRGQPLASLAIRGTASPALFEQAVSTLVRDLEPRIPAPQFETLAAARSRSVAQPQFFTLLIVVLAAVALIISIGGVYGVLAHEVEERRAEIGVRMSLGAGRWRVVFGIAGRGLAAASIGAIAGLVVGWALARHYEARLYGVTAEDPIAFLAILTLLGLATLGACAGPAWRAASVSPATVLRKE